MGSNNTSQSSETHPLFPSGMWEGFYTYSYGSQAGRHSMSFFLDFQDGEVFGSGSDNVGGFSWKGSYDTKQETCNLVKAYLTHRVLYTGHADENGIWGSWTIDEYMKGGFHIWPKQKEQEEQEEAELELKKPKQKSEVIT